jgi:undecaprenyl-diphosphatase
MRCSKRAAAEFSFFIAIPTMLGAFVFDFYKNRAALTGDDMGLIAIGFVVAFVAALVVVRTFVDFVARHGFVPFAWWRVVVGVLGLAGLWAFG